VIRPHFVRPSPDLLYLFGTKTSSDSANLDYYGLDMDYYLVSINHLIRAALNYRHFIQFHNNLNF
jgi:hypothetical protein